MAEFNRIILMVVSAVVAAIALPIAFAQLATMAANASAISLGVGAFGTVIAVVVVAGVLLGFTRHTDP